MEYVKACHTIGEELGESNIFEEDILTQIEGNLDNEEALSGILREMILQTSLQLEEDHHLSMAALALTGSFIEELFQAVTIIESYHNADLTEEEEKEKIAPLIRLVLDQEQALADLVTLLEDIPHDDTIRGILTDLDILDRMYKGELESLNQKIAADPNYVVTREEMFGVTLDIERIRAKIVE